MEIEEAALCLFQMNREKLDPRTARKLRNLIRKTETEMHWVPPRQFNRKEIENINKIRIGKRMEYRKRIEIGDRNENEIDNGNRKRNRNEIGIENGSKSENGTRNKIVIHCGTRNKNRIKIGNRNDYTIENGTIKGNTIRTGNKNEIIILSGTRNKNHIEIGTRNTDMIKNGTKNENGTRNEILIMSGTRNENRIEVGTRNENRTSDQNRLFEPDQKFIQRLNRGEIILTKLPPLGQAIDGFALPNIPPIASLQGQIGNCTAPFEKQLTMSDLNKTQARFALCGECVHKILKNFMDEREYARVTDEDHMGLKVTVYDMTGRAHKMKFVLWASKMHVLTKGWKEFCVENELEMHTDWVTVWMFRHKEDYSRICFAIIARRFPTEELVGKMQKNGNKNKKQKREEE